MMLKTLFAIGLQLNVSGYAMPKSSTSLQGRDKANALVHDIGRHVHVSDAQLDQDDDRSFGEFGFHYVADKDSLQMRILITRAHTKRSPQSAANFRKVAQALNDPKIGGMFDTGGGYFVLDENKDLYFLVKDFPVATTTPAQLWDELQHSLNLGATWTVSWFKHVAAMAHGTEPSPTHKITQANNPYPRQ